MRSARSGSSLMAKMPRLRARHQPVVDRQLVRQVAALGDLDRVDLADQVGDGDVGRRQLLAVAAVPRAASRSAWRRPARRRMLRAGGEIGASGSSLISRAGDERHLLVQQVDQRARDPGLGLAALAQEDDVLAGEDGVLDLREDRLLVADDAGEERLVRRICSSRFARSSCLTVRVRYPAARSSPSVAVGRTMRLRHRPPSLPPLAVSLGRGDLRPVRERRSLGGSAAQVPPIANARPACRTRAASASRLCPVTSPARRAMASSVAPRQASRSTAASRPVSDGSACGPAHAAAVMASRRRRVSPPWTAPSRSWSWRENSPS